jgi:hypothetical protein
MGLLAICFHSGALRLFFHFCFLEVLRSSFEQNVRCFTVQEKWNRTEHGGKGEARFVASEGRFSLKTQLESSPISLKPRRARSREVSSRYLSPNSTSSHESRIPSPNTQSLSPIGHKNSGTLGDHLGNERLKDRKKDKKSLFGKINASEKIFIFV